jgi:hypothetical protein
MNGLAPIIAFHEVIHEVIVVEVEEAVEQEEQQVFQTPVAAAANNHNHNHNYNYNNNNIFAPTPNPRSPPALLHKQRASEDDFSSVPAFSRAYTTKPSACRAIVF